MRFKVREKAPSNRPKEVTQKKHSKATAGYHSPQIRPIVLCLLNEQQERKGVQVQFQTSICSNTNVLHIVKPKTCKQFANYPENFVCLIYLFICSFLGVILPLQIFLRQIKTVNINLLSNAYVRIYLYNGKIQAQVIEQHVYGD